MSDLKILEKKFEDLCEVVEHIALNVVGCEHDMTSELQYGVRCRVCYELLDNCSQSCAGNKVNL